MCVSSITIAAKAPVIFDIASCTPSTSEPACSQMSAAITSVSEVVSKAMPSVSSS